MIHRKHMMLLMVVCSMAKKGLVTCGGVEYTVRRSI